MKFALALLIVMRATPVCADTWHGRLAIGDDVYAVKGETRLAEGVTRFSLSLSHSDNGPTEHSVVVTLDKRGGQVVFDRLTFPVSAKLAATWRRQLRTGLRYEPLPNGFDCKPAAALLTCDSKNLVSLDDGLSGRLRLIYNPAHLIGIRFFSLGEWNNPFFQSISLSLDLQ